MKTSPSIFSVLAWQIFGSTTSEKKHFSLLPEQVSNIPEIFRYTDEPGQPTHRQKLELKHQEILQEKFQAELKLELQAIHKEETQRRLTLEERDKRLITQFEQGFISFQELLKTFSKHTDCLGKLNLNLMCVGLALMDRKSENLKEEVRLKLQAIHEKESLRLLKLQEEDIKIIELLKQGNFSDDQLPEIRKHLCNVLETRPDDVCRIILELAEHSGIIMREAISEAECWDVIPIGIALKRNLLNTAEFIMQKRPSIALYCFNRHSGYLKDFIKSYSDDTLLCVFSEVREAEDWESKYCRLNPRRVLDCARNENKPKLFQYMLETLELQENP